MLDSHHERDLGKEFGRVHAASASCGTGTTTFGIGDEFELATRGVGIEAVGSGAWAQGDTEQKLGEGALLRRPARAVRGERAPD